MSLSPTSKQTLVVVGNGMVGNRFLEKLVDLGGTEVFRVIIFCEEPRPAYDRVHLSEYFTGKTAEDLTLSPAGWYESQGLELLIGDRACEIDTDRQVVVSASGTEIDYDFLVLATGSAPFVPPVPGIDKDGVFVYRTIEDLDAITSYARGCESAAVMGGGLLGLEAAKAVSELGLRTSVVEFAPRLMPRQLDDAGSAVLTAKIEELNIDVLTERNTRSVEGTSCVESLLFQDETSIEIDMLVVSAGIRPRDELARAAGLTVGPRGGVVVDELMRTSVPNIFAIGEVALAGDMIYGLVAPGYEMAEVAAKVLTAEPAKFEAADLSTKLKLLGVDVASFGDAFGAGEKSRTITFQDSIRGVYKRINISQDGTRLLGGMLVGDASDYGALLQITKNQMVLPPDPEDLILGSRGEGSALADMELPDSAQICSCENIDKGTICQSIRDNDLLTIADIKAQTKAGTGCGGCGPTLGQLLKQELAAAGKTISTDLCEHFPYTRQELFEVIKIKNLRSFDDVLDSHGEGSGCEVCKPAVASIIASLWNEPVFNHATIQDTNDRFMANIQRGGTYSVIPRVAGGEITPDQLITLGQVAKKYGLYSKITGGQRVVLFGARVDQLPDIWEELIAVGFESGHAYGKALRTIKSCVGTTWCRFGVGDSVGLAIRLENRYKGIRAPHKLKSAVSGCIRECAEAQSKDFGIISTENGWNLYVCGNGGARPRHADLLASDLDESTLVRFIDRFLMYYIRTADKLQRTARWLEQMDGGIDRLREIVVDDDLGIGEELERQMDALAGSYKCEWTELVNNPEKRKQFSHFTNSETPDPTLEFIDERGHKRPADWQKTNGTNGSSFLPVLNNGDSAKSLWKRVAAVEDIPTEGGACVKSGGVQIAVFHFTSKNEWYATQNMCPHKKDMVLSRGILGTQDDVPKVACPQHKKTFSLEDGRCLNDDQFQISTYPIRVSDGQVYVLLPDVEDVGDTDESQSSAVCEHVVGV